MTLDAAHAVLGSEHLAFACNGCGDCCLNLRVAPTHRDLERLARGLGARPESLVAWLPADAVDLEVVSASMVELPGGPHLLVLARGAAGCHLLGADRRCRAYAHRPLDCRVYPFVPERDEQRALRRLALFEPAGCGERGDAPVSVTELDALDRQRSAELDEYQALVARWNRLARHRRRLRHRAATDAEFLAFASGAALSS